MGRTKTLPQKRENKFCDNIINDYIPVTKKRKTFKKTNKITLICPTNDHEKYFLGKLLIGVTKNVFPKECFTCNVSFNPAQESLLLTYSECSVIVNCIVDVSFLKDLITIKVLPLRFSEEEGNVFIHIYLILPLPKFYNKVGACLKTTFKLLYNISNDNEELEEKETDMKEVLHIYDTITAMRKCDWNDAIKTNHPFLKPILRPYQEKAVHWMIRRESDITELPEQLHPLYTTVHLQSGINIYYCKFTGYVTIEKPLTSSPSKGGILADEMGLGKTVEMLACILLHPQKSNVLKSENTEPTIEWQMKKINIPPDKKHEKEPKIKRLSSKGRKDKSANRIALEMFYHSSLRSVNESRVFKGSLIQCICGSTTLKEDIVQCSVCQKQQHALCLGYEKKVHAYICPQCWMNEPIFDVGATLIVTPPSLRTQWIKEISKHIKGNLKVLVYEGFNATPVYPTKLKDYDIVITTYNVLKSELHLTETETTKTFRKQRKYSLPTSPLIRVKWWRLCLDEAQTVEIPTSMVSTMAQKLNANFRWAVTGTPVSKNISDIYGLIDYLQITPYNDFITWDNILYKPYISGNYNLMCTFLSSVMWRTEKRSVLDQINIPKQTFNEHLLEFSAVEKFFYKKEHEMIQDTFLSKLQKFNLNTALKDLDKATLKTVLAPLLTLRQICTHPNTIRGKYLVTRKEISSMKDLLEALILKNTAESEEMLRTTVSSLNGLAGISLLYGNNAEAIDYYRKVLQLSARFTNDKNEDQLNIDSLQLIHAMYNLAEILNCTPGINPTLRDASLKQNCSNLEQKYIEKFINQTFAAYNDVCQNTLNVSKLQNAFILKEGQWYSDGMDWITINCYYNELKKKIETHCNNAGIEYTDGGAPNILYHIGNWHDSTSNLRADLLESLNNLYIVQPEDNFKIIIPQTLVTKAMECHLRVDKKAKNKSKKCNVCIANKLFKNYEVVLFNAKERKEGFEDMSVDGTWLPTLQEILIKAISAQLKAKKYDPQHIKDGENHVNLINALKKEFKELRRFWTNLDQQVRAQDELDICKIRLRLKNPENEPKDNIKKKNVLKNLTYDLEDPRKNLHELDVHELSYQTSVLEADEKESMARLERNLGTQKYLQTLKSQQFDKVHPDPCPICKNDLENHWSILTCGHSYCLECIQLQFQKSTGDVINCPVCRSKQKFTDISYIKAGTTVSEEDTLQIKGNYSTKIEAIVKFLQNLKLENPKVKVLVFSTWVPVLKYLKNALDKNNIFNELVVTASNIEDKIEKFKDPLKNIMTLLLPLNLGAKGLNLIEATHIILTEPILNPADELQAIGRIHRIGQTQQTYVHKFIIKNTIEYRIHDATTSNSEKWDKFKVTIKQLKNLFVTDEKSEEVCESDEISCDELVCTEGQASNILDVTEDSSTTTSSITTEVANCVTTGFCGNNVMMSNTLNCSENDDQETNLKEVNYSSGTGSCIVIDQLIDSQPSNSN